MSDAAEQEWALTIRPYCDSYISLNGKVIARFEKHTDIAVIRELFSALAGYRAAEADALAWRRVRALLTDNRWPMLSFHNTYYSCSVQGADADAATPEAAVREACERLGIEVRP